MDSEIAEEIGMHAAYYSTFMVHEKQFQDHQLEAISKLIGVDIDKLVLIRYYRMKWVRDMARVEKLKTEMLKETEAAKKLLKSRGYEPRASGNPL